MIKRQLLLAMVLCTVMVNTATVDAPRTSGTSGNANTSVLPAAPVFNPGAIPPELRGVENPRNPTGRNMIVEVDNLTNPGTLTVDIVNQVGIQTGQDISGNKQLVETPNITIPQVPATNETKNVPVNTGPQQPSTNNSAAGNKTTEVPAVVPNPTPSTNNASVPQQNTTVQTNATSTGNNSSISPLNNQSVFNLNANTIPLFYQSNLNFKPENIDQLIANNDTFQQSLSYLRLSIKDYANASQLVYVDSNTFVPNITMFRVMYRVANGSFYRSTVYHSHASLQHAINITAEVKPVPTRTNFTSSVFADIEDSVRRVFKDYLNQSELKSVQQLNFTQLSTVVYQFGYSGPIGDFSVTIRTYFDVVSIMSFAKLSLPVAVKNYYTLFWNQKWLVLQEGVTVNRAILDYLRRRLNSRQVSILSVSATTNPETDRLRSCNSYIVDNSFATICASIGLTNRIVNIDYFKSQSFQPAPTLDGYSENGYSDSINDKVFQRIDQIAKIKYPSLIKNAPLTKIEYKDSPAARAWRLTYLSEDNHYVIVSYNP